MKSRDEIIDETRGTDFTPIASYTSEPFEVEEEERTTNIDVRIMGSDEMGYILHTTDDAGGDSDDLGDDVYPTLAAAVAALRALVLARPDGELNLVGEYAEADNA